MVAVNVNIVNDIDEELSIADTNNNNTNNNNNNNNIQGGSCSQVLTTLASIPCDRYVASVWVLLHHPGLCEGLKMQDFNNLVAKSVME